MCTTAKLTYKKISNTCTQEEVPKCPTPGPTSLASGAAASRPFHYTDERGFTFARRTTPITLREIAICTAAETFCRNLSKTIPCRVTFAAPAPTPDGNTRSDLVRQLLFIRSPTAKRFYRKQHKFNAMRIERQAFRMGAVCALRFGVSGRDSVILGAARWLAVPQTISRLGFREGQIHHQYLVPENREQSRRLAPQQVLRRPLYQPSPGWNHELSRIPPSTARPQPSSSWRTVWRACAESCPHGCVHMAARGM